MDKVEHYTEKRMIQSRKKKRLANKNAWFWEILRNNSADKPDWRWKIVSGS